MIIAHMIDINEMLKLIKGQGHKVKDLGQIIITKSQKVLNNIRKNLDTK